MTADAEMQSTGVTTDLTGNRATQQAENRDGNTVCSNHWESQLERQPMPRSAPFVTFLDQPSRADVATAPSARLLFLIPPGLDFTEVFAK